MRTLRRKPAVMEPAVREFLPALLEMRDHLPAPGARAVLRSVLALLALSLLWACTARVDVVAVARGHVVPVGGSKPLQSAEGGTVAGALAQASRRKIVTVQPWVESKDGKRYLHLPPDAGYKNLVREMPAQPGAVPQTGR